MKGIVFNFPALKTCKRKRNPSFQTHACTLGYKYAEPALPLE